MKTIFDINTRNEVINRINSLGEASTSKWGKMNIYQMIKHCTLWEEMIIGKVKCKRIFFGRLIGRIALKQSLKNETPMMQNAVTSPELIVKDLKGDIATEKAKWIALIEAHANYSNFEFVHPFFGKMTKEQVGYFIYKHTDHHLRQFNC
ncbi:MAG TPA: DUF1569 domain-containing protein [Cytophagaceae bacterium]|jgi:hypothetical protein